MNFEVGWIEYTPKSGRIKRQRCQVETVTPRKIYEGVSGGNGEAGNGGGVVVG
jgi:hypothetical protein